MSPATSHEVVHVIRCANIVESFLKAGVALVKIDYIVESILKAGVALVKIDYLWHLLESVTENS